MIGKVFICFIILFSFLVEFNPVFEWPVVLNVFFFMAAFFAFRKGIFTGVILGWLNGLLNGVFAPTGLFLYSMLFFTVAGFVIGCFWDEQFKFNLIFKVFIIFFFLLAYLLLSNFIKGNQLFSGLSFLSTLVFFPLSIFVLYFFDLAFSVKSYE